MGCESGIRGDHYEVMMKMLGLVGMFYIFLVSPWSPEHMFLLNIPKPFFAKLRFYTPYPATTCKFLHHSRTPRVIFSSHT